MVEKASELMEKPVERNIETEARLHYAEIDGVGQLIQINPHVTPAGQHSRRVEYFPT